MLMTVTLFYAQENRISLGGTDLKLGMTVEQALKALDGFELVLTDKDRGNSSAVVFTPKGKHDNIVGSIQFTAGKLTYVSAARVAYSGDSEAITLAKRLFSLISQASENGKKPGVAYVGTKYFADTNWTMNFVGITVGSKNILIRISDLNNKDYTEIEEELGFWRQQK